MIRKIHKHTTILKRRLRESATLDAIREERNATLDTVVDALRAAAENDRLPAFQRCEEYRRRLLNNHDEVDYTVFGLSDTATVSSVCKKASSPPVWGRLLYYLTDMLKAERVLEMGTNLGMSGSYILEALRERPTATFLTMDGVPKYAKMATEQFTSLVDDGQFEILVGNYDDTFPDLLEREPDFDLLFIDGNHREQPTVEYFSSLLPYVRRPSVWVFDDINWSPGMVRAWDTIRRHPDVHYSLDLWKLGVLIVDEVNPGTPRHFALHLAY